MQLTREKAGNRATRSDRVAALCLAIALSTLPILSGCVASENAPPARGYVVNGPPPPPIAESRPPRPNGTNPIWVAGYWHWVGVQYAWIPGHWEEAPPGSRWAAPQYSVRDGSYFYVPGDWQRAPGAPQRPANANAFH